MCSKPNHCPPPRRAPSIRSLNGRALAMALAHRFLPPSPVGRRRKMRPHHLSRIDGMESWRILHMRGGVRGNKCVPLQPCHRIATVIKHPKANQQVGGISIQDKNIFAVDSENHLREVGHNRNAVPKIKRHRTPWNRTIAADRAWKRRGDERGRLFLQFPRKIESITNRRPSPGPQGR